MDEQYLKSYLLVVLSGLKKHLNSKDSNTRYFNEADVQYLENLHELHTDLPFLAERMKEKVVANLPAKKMLFT